MANEKDSRPAMWVDPETGQVWTLPRRYVPDHFKRLDETEARDDS